LSDPHLNKFKKIQKIRTATTLSKFRRRCGYRGTMRWPCLTNNGSHITTLCLIAAVISILLGFIAFPNVHCNYHCTNMAVTKRSDVAAAAAATSKVPAKVSKPKDRSSKASQQVWCTPRWIKNLLKVTKLQILIDV
jgi:hypothetical protein